MKLTQKITKSLGVLALIFTFALSVSAQQRTITTHVSGDGGSGNISNLVPIDFFLKYHQNSRKLTISNLDHSPVNFRSVALVQVSSSGTYRALTKYYSGRSTRTFYPASYGINGICTLIIVDRYGKRFTLNFYVN